MEQLLKALGQQLGGDPIRQLSQQLGAPREQTASAVSAALPMLLASLGQQAQGAGGAQGLLAMLDRNGDGSILDDLAGFFAQGGGGAAAGGGILGQILGGRGGAVSSAVSRASGLGGAQVGQLLAMLAPVVLGYLTKMRGGAAPAPSGGGGLPGGLGSVLGGGAGGGGVDLGGLLGGLLGGAGGGGLGGMLGGQAPQGGRRAPVDDDGGLDDLARAGASILGGLLGGKR